MKDNLITIGEPCINDPGGFIYPLKVKGDQNYRGPWRVLAETDKVRSLLKQLGLQVYIYWVKVGKIWKVDKGKIKACMGNSAEVKEQTEQTHIVTIILDPP